MITRPRILSLLNRPVEGAKIEDTLTGLPGSAVHHSCLLVKQEARR